MAVQGMTSYNVAHVEKAVLFDDADLHPDIDPGLDPGGSINDGLAPFPAAAAGLPGAPVPPTEEALALKSQLEGDAAGGSPAPDGEEAAAEAGEEEARPAAEAVDPDVLRRSVVVGMGTSVDGGEYAGGSGGGDGGDKEAGERGEQGGEIGVDDWSTSMDG